MAKIISKIAFPIILTGIFAIIVFIALDYSVLNINFYIVFSVFVVYVFFFGFAIGQNFVSPLKKIIQRAYELTKGDLSSRVYLESKDELEELAKVFNELADKLEENKSTIEATEKGVDIKVKARTEALEETITALEQKVKNRTFELEKMISDSQKLQEGAKNKEIEMSELKKEINNFKKGLGKPKRKTLVEKN
ncbi:MAG: HAMP domain-containing protein [Patescibacteria group bacterium]